MGIRSAFSTYLDKRAISRLERRSQSASGCTFTFGLPNTASGETVTQDSALGLTAFLSGVTILSGSVSQLPLKVFKKTPTGKEEVPDHPVNGLLQARPNPDMTAVMFRDSRQQWVNTHGNGYAEIERDNIGRPLALWPLPADKVKAEWNSRDELVYEYTTGTQIKKQSTTLSASEVLHIPGFGFDGVTGRSIIAYARESLGEAQATQKAGAAFWANGARPTGMLEFPGMIKQDQLERLRSQFAETYSGAGNTGKPMLLEGGAKWSPTSIPPEDAQYLETRNFQVADIARMFNMPPHMLGDLSNAHFSNIEHQNRFFLQMTLMPWLIRWEQECNAKLFTEQERGDGYFVEHVVDAFLRGDTTSRFNAYKMAREGGWMSVNDIRRKENMNPIDGGDVYLSPLNMAPADDLRAHREHLKDALSKVVTKEVLAMRAAAKKGDFSEAAGKFYAGHASHVASVMTPSIRSLAETLGVSAEKYILSFASRHCEESLREMLQLGAGGADQELRVWEQFTAEREADLIIEELRHGERT